MKVQKQQLIQEKVEENRPVHSHRTKQFFSSFNIWSMVKLDTRMREKNPTNNEIHEYMGSKRSRGLCLCFCLSVEHTKCALLWLGVSHRVNHLLVTDVLKSIIYIYIYIMQIYIYIYRISLRKLTVFLKSVSRYSVLFCNNASL